MDIDKLILYIKSKPHDDYASLIDPNFQLWLENAPSIRSLDDISSVFFYNCFSGEDWFSLIQLLSNKYLRFNAENVSETHAGSLNDLMKNKIELFNFESLYSIGESSIELDFSILPNPPLKVELVGSKKIKLLKFGKEIEGIRLSNLQKLENIYLSFPFDSIRFFNIYKCNNINNFDFLDKIKKSLYVSLAGNNWLHDLNSLSSDSDMVILNLSESKVIKSKSTIDKLRSFKDLRYLTIQANIKEKNELMEALPNCFVNGRSL
ncbi:hypothetical protein [Pectobacterium parmentieri]|uniref:hypothetical protein n=1 Tax=Pectobacterium parmentieri TaxID=1905730 RepID=UPI000474187F|nr:hypothetical protein [Pectobacterium parmentieri]PWD57043.1 hypothetical protein DF211_21785 [Pectobacterium parmentieri]